MRDVLSDIVRHSAGLFETLRITGSTTSTVIRSTDQHQNLFLIATLKAPYAELAGSFGLGSLGMLEGLLKHPAYRTEAARLCVSRAVAKGEERVVELVFHDDRGETAVFKTMDVALLPELPVIKQMPWQASFAVDRARLAEFTGLTKVYKEVDSAFGIRTEDGKLVFHIGETSDTRHRASMVFEPAIDASLRDGLTYNIAQFLAVLRLCSSEAPVCRIGGHGILGITADSEHASYEYYLRAKV